MPRPIIDTEALRANLLAVMDSEPDSKTVFKQEGKRKVEEALNGVSPKRLRSDDAELDDKVDDKGKTVCLSMDLLENLDGSNFTS